jgi:hypothetical protein
MVTVAPWTNPLPLIVTVLGPRGMLAGETDATAGIGFKMVTVALAITLGVMLLATVTITVPLLGMVDGGTNNPPVSTEPALPVAPAGSATDQPTVVGVIPVTVSPKR